MPSGGYRRAGGRFRGPRPGLPHLGLASIAFVHLLAVSGCDPEGFRFRDTGFEIDLPECLRDFDCNDGISCTADDCVGLRCIARRPRALCPHGVCRLTRDQSCVGPASLPCERDEECSDDDPCTSDERCVEGFCSLEYTGDRDRDSDLVVECGGGDCDDADPNRSAYVVDRCNLVDDDCDGAVDEASCGRGECTNGGCACDPGTTLCGDGFCRALATDAAHCGECGNECASGGVCTDGVCSCPDGQEECDGVCLTPGTSAGRCGACQVACPSGAACVDGRCACDDSVTTACGSACVDLSRDPLHCGSCGARCETGCETCSEGECVLVPGAARCDGYCSQLDDAFDCGACDRRCPGGSRCERGTCSAIVCGESPVDPMYDSEHCGGCGIVCGAGRACVDGACVGETSCVRRASLCRRGADELTGFDGACLAADYGWCPRRGGLAGVITLGGLVSEHGGALALASVDVDGDLICAVGTVIEPEAGTRALVACFDRDGHERGIAALGGADGPWSRSGADIAVRGTEIAHAGTVCVRGAAEDGCFGLEAHRFLESRLEIGGRTSGEAIAVRPLAAPALAGRFEGSLVGLCASWTCPTPVASRGHSDAFVMLRDDAEPSASPRAVLGGAGDDAAHAVAALDDGDVVVVGSFAGSLLTPPLVGHGGRDGFAARVRADGTIAWTIAIGGTGRDEALRVGARASEIVVAGTFQGSIALAGVERSTPSGSGVFVLRLDPETGAERAATVIDAEASRDPSALLDPLHALAPRLGLDVREDGIVAVGLTFAGTITVGPHVVTSAGGRDALVAWIATDGRVLGVRSLGGAGDDRAVALALDVRGVAWVAAELSGPIAIDGVTVDAEEGGDVALLGIGPPARSLP